MRMTEQHTHTYYYSVALTPEKAVSIGILSEEVNCLRQQLVKVIRPLVCLQSLHDSLEVYLAQGLFHFRQKPLGFACLTLIGHILWRGSVLQERLKQKIICNHSD